MRFLLDTNIIVFLLRGRQEVARAIDRVGLENCAISEITKAELLAGFYKAQMMGRHPDGRFFDLLDALTVLPISSAVECYARELARLQLAGERIDDFDLLIAATAVTNHLTLVTENLSHLGRVRDVVIENWVKR